MAELHNDWKELKQGLGTFVNRIEGMLGGATDIEAVKKSAYEKGLRESAVIEKERLCSACSCRIFYKHYCKENNAFIQQFCSLSSNDQYLVRQMVKRMLEDYKHD